MNLDALLNRIKTLESCQLGRGATEQEIEEAAMCLGIRFPDQYADYLRRVGWVSCSDFELFGLGKGIPSFLDVVSNTIKERHHLHPHIPTFLLPVMADGAGNHYCLFVEGPNKDKVGFWDHEHEDEENQQPEIVGLSFVDWLNSYINDIPRDN